MNQLLFVITIIIFCACAYWLLAVLPTHKTTAFGAQSFTGKVRYVVDGDSLYIHGHKPQVRLWGVNTPERHEAGFNEATAFLAQIVGHRPIKCRKMHVDPYKRTVGQCFLPDGRDIGGLMIRSGHAKEMFHFSKGYYSR